MRKFEFGRAAFARKCFLQNPLPSFLAIAAMWKSFASRQIVALLRQHAVVETSRFGTLLHLAKFYRLIYRRPAVKRPSDGSSPKSRSNAGASLDVSFRTSHESPNVSSTRFHSLDVIQAK